MTTNACSISMAWLMAFAASMTFFLLLASAQQAPPPPPPAAPAHGGGHCNVQKDLVIMQSLGDPQRDGSSAYTVTVSNQCSGSRHCTISGIHLMCGNFRSLMPVDPRTVSVVAPGDCLLANGQAIRRDGNVSFVYSSFVRNELYVKNATCVSRAAMNHRRLIDF